MVYKARFGSLRVKMSATIQLAFPTDGFPTAQSAPSHTLIRGSLGVRLQRAPSDEHARR